VLVDGEAVAEKTGALGFPSEDQIVSAVRERMKRERTTSD
jgi:hypothetical protein